MTRPLTLDDLRPLVEALRRYFSAWKVQGPGMYAATFNAGEDVAAACAALLAGGEAPDGVCVCAETSIRNCPVHGQDAPAPAPERDGELEWMDDPILSHLERMENLVRGFMNHRITTAMLLEAKQRVANDLNAYVAQRVAEARAATR